MRYSSFLPISNITGIAFESLLNEEFFSKAQNLDLQTKIKIAQKVFYFKLFIKK